MVSGFLAVGLRRGSRLGREREEDLDYIWVRCLDWHEKKMMCLFMFGFYTCYLVDWVCI